MLRLIQRKTYLKKNINSIPNSHKKLNFMNIDLFIKPKITVTLNTNQKNTYSKLRTALTGDLSESIAMQQNISKTLEASQTTSNNSLKIKSLKI